MGRKIRNNEGENFPTHPIPYKFSGKIREIYKILRWMWDFDGRRGIFPFCEPEHNRGDLVDLEKFSYPPIPYIFSTFIREVFKILWGRWKIMRLSEKIPLFLAHP